MGPTPIPTFPHRKGEGVKKAICLGSLNPATQVMGKDQFGKGGVGGILRSNATSMLGYNKNLKKHSQELRKNMTDAEGSIWSRVRCGQLRGKQFYRQKIIGNYIVDFYCPKAKLVIEIDGGQHYSEEGIVKDKIRDHYLKGLGLRILRFSDREVFENSDGVIEKVLENL